MPIALASVRANRHSDSVGDGGIARQLRDRWLTQAGAELTVEVVRRLLSGRGLSDLDLSTVDGRTDLRLLPSLNLPDLDQPGRWQAFRDVELSHLDFTGATLPGVRFHGVRIVDCVFRDASCPDWRMWSSQVSDCDFAGASLRESALGTWQEGKSNDWVGVGLRRADLRGCFWKGSLIDRCDFSNSRLEKASFEQCDLRGTRFTGSIKRVTFDERPLPDRPPPRPAIEVDFTGAVFSDVEFRGVTLERATLPDDADLLLIRNYGAVVRQALGLLAGDESLPARMLRAQFENNLRMMRADREDAVLNRRDFLRSGGDQLADLAQQVLGEAQRLATLADPK